jgi:hypothetical protein
MGKLLLTDGAKFLADQAGCYWLYDIVYSTLPRLPDDWFAVVKLKVDLGAKRGVVIIEDGNGHEFYRQEIPFTDFPLAEITRMGTSAADPRRCSCCQTSTKSKTASRGQRPHGGGGRIDTPRRLLHPMGPRREAPARPGVARAARKVLLSSRHPERLNSTLSLRQWV